MAGFLLLKIMSKQTYYEKLKDPRWQRKRLEVMQRSNFCCQQCHRDDVTLNVHHVYYMSKRDPWDYPNFALQCVCEECHGENHESCEYTNFESLIELIAGDDFENPILYDFFEQVDCLKCDFQLSHNQLLDSLVVAVRDMHNRYASQIA